jgi:Signal peptidase, peptidase S26
VDKFIEMVEQSELWRLVEKALQIPPEYAESKEERILEAKLDAMGSAYKVQYYHKQRNLFAHGQRHGLRIGKGDSVLPTMWNPCHAMTISLHPTRDMDILSQVKVGDIVSFLLIPKPGQTKSLCKRIVGLPGDHVKTIEGKMVQVPNGGFWALGDNPDESFDSRHFGAVPSANLKAKHAFAFTVDPP